MFGAYEVRIVWMKCKLYLFLENLSSLFRYGQSNWTSICGLSSWKYPDAVQNVYRCYVRRRAQIAKWPRLALCVCDLHLLIRCAWQHGSLQMFITSHVGQNCEPPLSNSVKNRIHKKTLMQFQVLQMSETLTRNYESCRWCLHFNCFLMAFKAGYFLWRKPTWGYRALNYAHA
jgi:hypothetical protein